MAPAFVVLRVVWILFFPEPFQNASNADYCTLLMSASQRQNRTMDMASLLRIQGSGIGNMGACLLLSNVYFYLMGATATRYVQEKGSGQVSVQIHQPWFSIVSSQSVGRAFI
jgi:hypothetical protein